METLLVNPRRKKRRVKKNIEEVLALNPRKRKRARKNIEEVLLLNPRRRRRIKKNPVFGKMDLTTYAFALAGGAGTEIVEKVLRLIKKDDKIVIPSPIRTLAFPVLSFLLGKPILKKNAEPLILGSIGATTAKILEEIEKQALPPDVKVKIGLSGLEQIKMLEKDLEGLSEKDVEYIREMLPYILEAKRYIASTGGKNLPGGGQQQIPPPPPPGGKSGIEEDLINLSKNLS